MSVNRTSEIHLACATFQSVVFGYIKSDWGIPNAGIICPVTKSVTIVSIAEVSWTVARRMESIIIAGSYSNRE
jgi:hypothetical protein